ncbi:hypothetical protein [Nocardia altamirensis]|uniref:hypothetical protein n=1 Tax=Nocardia altamirensis TaxID=472158 RepID=UPI000840645A|nr:hypothetical protein [Nocardia altamirensis]
MQDEPRGRRELVSAMFSSEFVEGGIDLEALRRVHRGEHDEWRTALDRSGVFGKEVLAELTDQWRRDPSQLLDALLADADDVTRRRCLTAWAELDNGAAGSSAAQIS